MFRSFRDFAFKGNLIDVAIAFVLGVAFAAVVTSLVNDVIMNLIAAIVGKPSFDDLTFNIGDGVIRYGSFLTALITFLIIAFVLFLIVQALQKVMPAKTVSRDCPHCLSEIPIAAGTCAFCGKDSPAAAAA
jgi:large conductance mechanosensitive channel